MKNKNHKNEMQPNNVLCFNKCVITSNRHRVSLDQAVDKPILTGAF